MGGEELGSALLRVLCGCKMCRLVENTGLGVRLRTLVGSIGLIVAEKPICPRRTNIPFRRIAEASKFNNSPLTP